MRTAEEILNSAYQSWIISGTPYNWKVEALNEARKESIEECAEKLPTSYKCIPSDVKQSILNLIKELK